MSSPSIFVETNMPTPPSAEAPYFDDQSNAPATFFLREYDTIATSHGLSGKQKLETIVHYIARPMRDHWKTLEGYSTGDWETFKLALESRYPDTSTARHYIPRILQDFVHISAKNRMQNEHDVMTYYRCFLTISKPLINKRLITVTGRNIEFILGFHPDDRAPLNLRLFNMKPNQPPGQPYDIKDSLRAARIEFSGRPSGFLSQRGSPHDISTTVKWLMYHQGYNERRMRRGDGREGRDPRRFRQDSQDGEASFTHFPNRGPRNQGREDRDFLQEQGSFSGVDRAPSSRLSTTSAPQSETQPVTSLITQTVDVSPYMQSEGCIFCADRGHSFSQCSTANDYVRTGRIRITNYRLRLPNGEPIPNDGKGRGLKPAIDEWILANIVSSTRLLTL